MLLAMQTMSFAMQTGQIGSFEGASGNPTRQFHVVCDAVDVL
jgi:hypothetical protein